ncbi:hypothetical protein HanRHA438_Chr05g0246401 [Helianthus annuus]|nr:hypothetical protein HanRHA438_Chr05g0246401 [Helianthus annuus]
MRKKKEYSVQDSENVLMLPKICIPLVGLFLQRNTIDMPLLLVVLS